VGFKSNGHLKIIFKIRGLPVLAVMRTAHLPSTIFRKDPFFLWSERKEERKKGESLIEE